MTYDFVGFWESQVGFRFLLGVSRVLGFRFLVAGEDFFRTG